jgi:O-antigen ligase
LVELAAVKSTFFNCVRNSTLVCAAASKLAKDADVRGAWHDTHNTFTQVSSEAGIPAFLLYLAALISTYRLLSRVYRRSRNQPSSPESRKAAVAYFCVLLSFVAFSAASFFLSLAYRFYLPAITSVAIALTLATEHKRPPARRCRRLAPWPDASPQASGS